MEAENADTEAFVDVINKHCVDGGPESAVFDAFLQTSALVTASALLFKISIVRVAIRMNRPELAIAAIDATIAYNVKVNFQLVTLVAVLLKPVPDSQDLLCEWFGTKKQKFFF